MALSLPNIDVTMEKLHEMFTKLPSTLPVFIQKNAMKPVAFYTKKSTEMRHVYLVGNALTIKISQQYGSFSDFYIVTAMDQYRRTEWAIFLNTFQCVFALVEGKLPARNILRKILGMEIAQTSIEEYTDAPSTSYTAEIEQLTKEEFSIKDSDYIAKIKEAHQASLDLNGLGLTVIGANPVSIVDWKKTKANSLQHFPCRRAKTPVLIREESVRRILNNKPEVRRATKAKKFLQTLQESLGQQKRSCDKGKKRCPTRPTRKGLQQQSLPHGLHRDLPNTTKRQSGSLILMATNKTGSTYVFEV